jgi:hypothetical protein
MEGGSARQLKWTLVLSKLFALLGEVNGNMDAKTKKLLY